MELPQTMFTLNSRAGYEAHEANATLSLTLDRAVDEHWHLLLGSVWDRLDFSGGAAGSPGTLQYAAAKLGVEYRVQDEPVFSLNFQPGLYGDEDLSSGAFDVPVRLEAGYPLDDHWALAGGLDYSRLGEFFLPIFGVVANFAPQWELALIFPEPTLSYRPDEKTTATLFMELLDTGYRLSDGRRLGYYQSHAGASWEREFRDGWSASVKAGWAFDRTFDFFQHARSGHPGDAPFVELGLSKIW